ncbi:MAG: AI-2E family transporter [Spirochaetales bacterium]|nr:AI-2E family transporter [Spirochaetales bacterium]
MNIRGERLSTVFLGILVLIALGTVMKIASDVVIPLSLAILISFIVSPIIRFLERIKIPRIAAIVIVIILFFGMFYLVGLILYASAKSFIGQLPKYQERFAAIIAAVSAELDRRFPLEFQNMERINWMEAIRSPLISFSNSIIEFGSKLVIITFFLVFLLSEKHYFRSKVTIAFKSDMSDRIGAILSHINEQIARYLSVKFFISLATGILVWLALSIIGLDFPIIWGTLAFFLNFIPNIGSSFIIVFTILMSVVQFYPQWGPISAVSITMLLIQLIMGNIIDPRMQGRRLDVSPFLILVSLIFWGWLWGIIGMFLSVPLTVIIKIICENIPFLKPISIIMGSGKTVKRELKE